MEHREASGTAVDRRRFLKAGGLAVAAGATAYAAPRVARANLSPGLSAGEDATITVKIVIDCLDVLVMELQGVEHALAEQFWYLFAEVSFDFNRDDGPGAIAALQAIETAMSAPATLAVFNAAQGGLRDSAFSGEGGIGDGILDAVRFLISLGPVSILDTTVVVTLASQETLRQCDQELATCRGVPFVERQLPLPFLFFPEPLGSALYAAGVQVTDMELGNPPCYASLQSCVAAVAASL